MRTNARAWVVLLIVALVPACAAVVTARQVPPSTDPPPAVSDVFALRRENLALKQQVELLGSRLTVCHGQLAPGAYQASMVTLEQERQRLIADFEAAHPGWTLDTATGQVVKKPAPKKDGGGA